MELNVYDDCLNLVKEFIDSELLQFENFCQIWQNMSFYHIWSAQTTNIEIIQTTKAAMHVAKRLACGRSINGNYLDIQDKHYKRAFHIAGVYLMYSLYFKQPTSEFVKIIVSPHTWAEIRSFLQDADHDKSKEMDQVRYIFWKLVQSQAFVFSSHDFPLGLEGLVNYDNLHNEVASENALRIEVPCLTKTKNLLQPLRALEDGYNKMKVSLSKVSGANAEALPETKIFRELLEGFENIDNILDDSLDSKSKNSQIVMESKRAAIKRKAYCTNNIKNEIILGDESSEDDLAEGCEILIKQEKPYVQRRMSAQTIFNQELPKDILEELEQRDDCTINM